MTRKICCLITIFVFIHSLSNADVREAGRVSYLEGRADIVRSAKGEATFLKDSDLVYVGDCIRTKSHSKVAIAFRDGSVVRLAPGTRIEVSEYELDGKDKRQDAKIKITRGKIRAIVAKASKADSFTIVTPNAAGTVKGSDIFVYYQAGKTGVLVTEGHMSILNQALPEKKEEVIEGDCALVPFKNPPAQIRPYYDSELSRYKKDTEPTVTAIKMLAKDATKMYGTITVMSGGVRVQTSGESDWHYARLNEVVSEGSKVQTSVDGRVEIRLDNGNILSLQPDSEIVLKILRRDPKTGDYENSFESSTGKIKAVVEKLGKNSTFQVKTPTAMCGVRGTVMYLDVQPTATAAYYEGGYGEVTNTISGQSTMVEAGQNSVADNTGTVSAPAYTTNEQRLNMDEAWSGDPAAASAQGYTSPDTAPVSGETVSGTPTGPTGPVVDNAAKPPVTDKPFDSVPINQVITTPGTQTTTTTVSENRAFAAYFGYIGIPGGETVARLVTDPGSTVAGTFTIASFASSVWDNEASGTPVYGDLSGTYSNNPLHYKLWVGDAVKCTLSDGGSFRGLIGASMVGSSLRGKLAAIYIDPSGHAGTITSYFSGTRTGTNSDGTFTVSPNPLYHITQRESVPIAAGDLYTASVEEFAIEGRGQGSFDFTGGTLVCGDLGSRLLSGKTTNLTGYRWGIWYMEFMGNYSGVTNSSWRLALGGEQGLVNSDKSFWIGTVNGTEWGSNILSGSFKGIWLSKTVDDPLDHRVTAGLIENGSVAGDYDSTNWEAIGAGEWVQVTDTLSETNLTFTVSNLQTFVSVPITEVHATQMSGLDINFNSSANIRFYDNGTAKIWTGIVEGSYSGSVASNWSHTLYSGGYSMTLTGDQWSNSSWHATVAGAGPGTPGEVANFTGEAGGTYNTGDNKLQGIAAGTWDGPI